LPAAPLADPFFAAGGRRSGVLPHFFIGAHAAVSRLKLPTRDVRRYNSYYPLISPQQ
jgi:predicted nucleic acid-binding protein